MGAWALGARALVAWALETLALVKARALGTLEVELAVAWALGTLGTLGTLELVVAWALGAAQENPTIRQGRP